MGPEKDVEVFLIGFQAVDDAVEQKSLVLKCIFEYPVIAFVEFRPVFVAKEMFKKFRAKIAGPVFANPTANGVLLAYIEARFLAFDPLKNGHLLVAISIKATNFHGPGAPNRVNSALGDTKTTNGSCEPLHAAFTVFAIDFTLFFARVQAQRAPSRAFCVKFFTNRG